MMNEKIQGMISVFFYCHFGNLEQIFFSKEEDLEVLIREATNRSPRIQQSDEKV